jgi:hypothetical protein
MQITYTATGAVQLKTKTVPVTINDHLSIGDKVISGPGEYDIASIQCEGKALPLATVYFIRDEDLLVTYLTHLDPEVTKLDDASDTAILALHINSEDTATAAKNIIKALEPAYLFLMGAGATSAFIEELGFPLGEAGSLKITRAGLPLEGTTLIPNA